jgi:phenylalanine-4-hydroxylase
LVRGVTARFNGTWADGTAARHVQGLVEGTKASVVFTISDKPGALEQALRLFWKADINMTRIESRPNKQDSSKVDFFVDFEGQPEDPAVKAVMASLEKECGKDAIAFAGPTKVPWFPTHISDIDSFSGKTLDAGAELESDHPGFNDATYRERRKMIVENAASFKYGQEIPRVEYTKEETETWGVVWDKLQEHTDKYAVRQYKQIMPLMERHCGFARDNIPQLQDISDFLKRQTGFSMRPVQGLLSARDFLNALAFRVFFSTQYIRHHSTPLYTPEPDIVHELMGHAPMFADPDFADFSHEIGLASLGASDAEIKRLATCYWFSVEFGLCREDGAVKAYGAGLLSSFGELEYACAPYRPAGGRDVFPEHLEWEPEVAAVTTYPITDYQPTYFVAESLHDAKVRMRAFCDQLPRPFNTRYDPLTGTVSVDRAVERGVYQVTLQTD